ncbi:MAG TPA: efflux transporter outer membrane subunit [Verrucomicrobiae bacterium]
MKLGFKKKTAPAPDKPLIGPAGATTAVIAAVLLLSSVAANASLLTVGPDYHTPTNNVPVAYKAAGYGDWKEGQPLDNVPKGAWWQVYGDTNLDTLEAQALQANQQLKAAVARVDQSRDTARVARGKLMPSVSLDPSYERQRYSPNAVPSFGSITANTFSTPLDLSYEVDLWGRVRRSFESARADAQASLAEFYNVLLTLQADVAQNYFALRSLDAEISTVSGTVDLRKEQVKLTQARYDAGIGNELEVAQAQTELATTQAQLASLQQQRDQLENAIAILVGESPSNFSLPAIAKADVNWHPLPPEIPAGLPSDLLERRPDVATAERRLASANAKIGVAKASFFPVITLTGSGGYLSGDVSTLFNWESRTWSFGPGISLPIFAGGRNRANYHRAQAAYDEAVADYRQQVLVAFGDIEDSLSDIRHLADQSEAQERAVENAQRAADLAQERYTSGIVSYIEVVDANRDSLSAERDNAQLIGQRLIASVQLIKALGGGWDARQIYAPVAVSTVQTFATNPK